MTPSELARQNAIPLELKKDGLFQRQTRDWVLRFVVQATDMNEQIMKAPWAPATRQPLLKLGVTKLTSKGATRPGAALWAGWLGEAAASIAMRHPAQ